MKATLSSTSRGGGVLGNSRGAAIADYDNDGDLDIFVANFAITPNWLFHSNGADNNFLVLKPVGTISNRNAIEAKVTAVATIGGEEVTQVREITTASSRHAQDSLSADFGLGEATSMDITVKFLSGIVVELKQVEPNQTFEILEAAPSLPNTGGIVPPWQTLLMVSAVFLIAGVLFLVFWRISNPRSVRP
jgi:LPXTG-motif cell wall-anchored protein